MAITDALRDRVSSYRWPLVFSLEPSDLSFAERAPFVIDTQARIRATPERVFDELVELEHGRDWIEHFIRVEWQPQRSSAEEKVFIETFSFMSLKIRTLAAERGRRWVASVDACSMPLAKRMLEVATFEPDGDRHVRFRWRIHYETHDVIRPLVPTLKPFFDRMFQRSTERLAELCERGP
jgi:hypothetical protein